MFTARKKIAKEAGAEPTELEEQVAQVRRALGSGQPWASRGSMLPPLAAAVVRPPASKGFCSAAPTLGRKPTMWQYAGPANRAAHDNGLWALWS